MPLPLRQLSAVLDALPGPVRRKIVWFAVRLSQPRFLVSVCAVLRAPDGRVLLFEHRFWEDGRWGVPSGHMQPGETPQAAAARELREESGLRATDLRVVDVVGGQRHRVEIWLRGSIDVAEAPGQDVLQAREICRAALLPPDRAVRTARPGQARVLRAILAREDDGGQTSGNEGNDGNRAGGSARPGTLS
ncbi:NUDIX hydrolase [Brachybacterium sp. NPDC056505]|uniref:NUDIX hydrolase n=1 Tax=Brachybacterium sp. NPDC056505 TaxID=3345843 RepID=UPI00366E4330